MAISSAFSTALTGLRSHQSAIDVTSNNISNASNPDYVRQRAVFSSLPSINSVPGDIGTGVEISSVKRITDTFLFNRYTSTSASYANLDTQEQYLKEIAAYFPDVTDNGLYKDIEDFFNAWQTFASNPNDGAVKVDLAAKTQILSDNIKNLKNKLTDIQKSLNDSLEAKTEEADDIIKQIADLNKQISSIEANNQTNANELRDKRDALEKRLKELLDVKVLKSGVVSQDAQGDVTTGYEENYQIMLGGYTLVDNSTFNSLTTKNTEGNVSVQLEKQDHTLTDITKDISGGEIGALISLRGTEFNSKAEPTNGTVSDLLNSLNALAGGIIRSVNSIYSYSAQESVTTDTISSPISLSENMQNEKISFLNSSGILKTSITDGKISFDLYDENGNLDSTNSPLTVNVNQNESLQDVLNDINAKLSSIPEYSNIKAQFVNGQIKFINTDTQKTSSNILVKDDGAKLFTALNQIEYLPLSQINSSLPQPLKNGSFEIKVYDSEGNEIATRSITVNMDSSDPKFSTIEGIMSQINTPSIDDNQNNNQNDDVDDFYHAEFINGKFLLSKTTDQNTLVGLDEDSSDFGGAFGINRFFDGKDASDIALNADLQNDPSLISAGKIPDSGDNSIANAVLQLQSTNINFYTNSDTKTETIYGFYREMTSSLANQTQSVSDKKETAQTLLTNISNEYYSLSGVNIDEELINLEKYQRGYQANAKVITTINQMLDALFTIKQ
ncbi:flagellar hook-associated protein FlgK [Nautilia sp.]